MPYLTWYLSHIVDRLKENTFYENLLVWTAHFITKKMTKAPFTTKQVGYDH